MNNTYAGRIHLVTEIFNQGMLCNCTEREVEAPDEDGEERSVIVHKENCGAVEEAKKLIALASSNE